MSHTDRPFGREVRTLLNEAQEVHRWNSSALGVKIFAAHQPSDITSIRFVGKTGQEVRDELLDAVIEYMTRYPFDELRFQLSVDYGVLGNAFVTTWAATAYYLTIPARVFRAW